MPPKSTTGLTRPFPSVGLRFEGRFFRSSRNTCKPVLRIEPLTQQHRQTRVSSIDRSGNGGDHILVKRLLSRVSRNDECEKVVTITILSEVLSHQRNPVVATQNAVVTMVTPFRTESKLDSVWTPGRYFAIAKIRVNA